MTNQTSTIDFDSTITALQQDPTAISLDDAIAMIDAWRQELQGHDIAEDLGELKQALRSGDSAKISEILADLGEDTTGVAADLPADVSGKIQQIGTLLTQLSQKAG